MIKNAIADGDIFKSTIRFSTEFYPAGWPCLIWNQMSFIFLLSALNKSPYIVTRNLAIHNGNIFRRFSKTQGH